MSTYIQILSNTCFSTYIESKLDLIFFYVGRATLQLEGSFESSLTLNYMIYKLLK